MTTPSEITATERLLELIRASSSTEKKDAVHGNNTSDLISEPNPDVPSPQKTEPHSASATTARVLAPEKDNEIPLTLETPADEGDNAPSPSPPLEQPISPETSTTKDTDKLLDLIRSSLSSERKDADQATELTEPIADFDSQLPNKQNSIELSDLESTETALTTDEESNFTLTLENNEISNDTILNVEKPSPPPQPEQPSPSDHSIETPVADESAPLLPSAENNKPSASSHPHDDDDEDILLFPQPDQAILHGPEHEDDKVSASLTPPSAFSLRSLLNLKRLSSTTKTTIGIDIRPGVIHIVKSQTNKNGPDLLAYESVPYEFAPVAEPINLFEDQEFMAVLFKTVASFHTSQEHHEIWCSYPFVKPVELHNITIPKVAEKDLSTAVYWSAKRELEFDETIHIFDYFPLQEITESNQAKIQTLVTLAPQTEVDGVKSMFKNAGFPLTGISFPAAAIQNYLHHDPSIPTDQPVVYFTIRKNYSFIDLFHQGKIFFSRVIKTGTDSFVESLIEQAQSQNIVIDEENAKEYLFRSGAHGTSLHHNNSTLAPLFDWEKLSVIGRLARQLVRTFEYCSTTFKIPPVGAIATSGEFIINDAILKSVENKVGIKCSLIEPLSSTIFHQNSVLSPPSISNLIVAAGLSLSNIQTTANFLFTYAHRARETSSKKVNSLIAIVSICLAISLGVTFAWQYNKELDKKQDVIRLQAQLENNFKVEPRTRDSEYLTQSVQKITQFHLDNKSKTKRFKAVALITELTRTLGKEITLTDLVLDLEPETKVLRNPQETPLNGSLTISGFISAPSENQDFILMSLLKDLAQLKMLSDPILQSQTNASLNNQEILRFEVRLTTSLSFLDPPAT
ncbi:MAG: hypothetical protein KKD63_13280 [Proteobacteria bacterium]|nr:hypothetical protein [Desulfobulbaceae bacterium]MBU4153840.1 hypothetical protein [Pseudomonadota bacterium]